MLFKNWIAFNLSITLELSKRKKIVKKCTNEI